MCRLLQRLLLILLLLLRLLFGWGWSPKLLLLYRHLLLWLLLLFLLLLLMSRWVQVTVDGAAYTPKMSAQCQKASVPLGGAVARVQVREGA